MMNMLKNSLLLIFLFYNANIIAQKTRTIDSLYFSNNIGKKYILYIKEDRNASNRLVQIYSKNRKNLIAENRILIPCAECGGMRGDPYISISKNENYGFTIYLDNNQIDFKSVGNNFILLKSEFIQVMQCDKKITKGKITTKKTLYTPKKTIYFKNYSIEILTKNCSKQIY